MKPSNCHFGGYATRNDLLCGDGRTIREGAFKECDGKKVPLVWNHDHTKSEAVLGHAILENRKDGVYAYCTFNETDAGKNARTIVEHGDISSLSIYANRLKQHGMDVIHGVICELSLVLAGANPGAYIDFVMAHGDNSEDCLYAHYNESAITIYHSAEEDPDSAEDNPEDKPEDTSEGDSEETVEDVFNTLSDKQKDAVYEIVATIVANEDDEDSNNEKGDNEEMKHNVFDKDKSQQRNSRPVPFRPGRNPGTG